MSYFHWQYCDIEIKRHFSSNNILLFKLKFFFKKHFFTYVYVRKDFETQQLYIARVMAKPYRNITLSIKIFKPQAFTKFLSV